MTQDREYREMALRGKYERLYSHLSGLGVPEWRTSFREIESILGFDLPRSARLHRPWWANQAESGGHTQALSWGIAGWVTAEVNMNAETLLFKRKQQRARRQPNLDEIWPVHSVGGWPDGMSLRREDIYDERV